MLKAIKLGFLLIAATVFVAGCASTSETIDTTEVESTPVSTADSSAADAASSSEAQTEEVQVVEEVLALESVFYFEFDQATLTREAATALLANAAILKANPRSIRLEGHADERGTREYNIALGERRAIAVRNFLRFEGVNSPIEIVSYGEEQPASYASTEEAYQLNRRVELK